ncbi:FAD-dependent oxidoreductase, partial [Patescibacteria group bacterium]|nr:FAD-dependent oxidoreductase [Patescibacteria group bacterium]
DLALNLRKHIEQYTTPENTLTLALGKRADEVQQVADGFTVLTGGNLVATKSILVATGSHHRKLDVPGAKEFENKGIMYCATCDGPLFGGQPVAVAGGGNAALEAVLQLSQYASHVTLIHRSESFRADTITVEEVAKLSNVTLLKNTEIQEIRGEMFVNGLTYKDKTTEETTDLAVSGLFVEIGQIPNTTFLDGVIELSTTGTVVVDPSNQRTNIPGIWAAGDCTNGLYHQNNIAAGDAVKAIEDLYLWIKTGK